MIVLSVWLFNYHLVMYIKKKQMFYAWKQEILEIQTK